MKTYTLFIEHDNDRVVRTVTWRQPKRARDSIASWSRNHLVKRITMLTKEYGEYEHAGEYSEKKEVVYERPSNPASALGRLSALSRDTSSEAMRNLANKRWGNK